MKRSLSGSFTPFPFSAESNKRIIHFIRIYQRVSEKTCRCHFGCRFLTSPTCLRPAITSLAEVVPYLKPCLLTSPSLLSSLLPPPSKGLPHPTTMISRNTLCTVLLSSTVLCSAYQWPDPQYEALERLLYEGTDINNLPTSILTNSCGRRVTNGSPVAAEWLRLVSISIAVHSIRIPVYQFPAIVIPRRRNAQHNGWNWWHGCIDIL